MSDNNSHSCIWYVLYKILIQSLPLIPACLLDWFQCARVAIMTHYRQECNLRSLLDMGK